MNRKSAKSNSADDSTRCVHRTPSGRRCKLPAVVPNRQLCGTHLHEHLNQDLLDHRQQLLSNWQGFQTAQEINFALGDIFQLLAANAISARRASVLAFICSQLLRTLPAIDADRAAGINYRNPAPPAVTPAQESVQAQPDAGTPEEAASAELPTADSPASPTASLNVVAPSVDTTSAAQTAPVNVPPDSTDSAPPINSTPAPLKSADQSKSALRKPAPPDIMSQWDPSNP